MNEAISRDDWERMERGLKPIKRKVIPRPEPEPPVVEKLIKFSDIPLDWFKSLDKADRRTIKNKDGVSFVGYDVEISLGKNKVGAITNEEKNMPKSMKGWMMEGHFQELVRNKRKEIDQQVIHW
jgi:hypothetical protein